ncbi:DUF1648 domain-containing protein [Microbacterium oleivorans]|uniref:DUF1648 domain-containing protein n=1 Tax=Microbacterium oleivorans TaxID=273677 RepID=UPI0020408C0B|nr:DUF1648 domain-containing protein [Microbacterium oleivorans]MCM3696171.1 DUF1648 domain-containing protein [Microbacterium oleivorans]
MTTDIHTLARRRFTLVAVLLPALVTVVALVAQVLLLSLVPGVVATHWGWAGTPDGFAPSWTVPLMTALLGLGLPALLFAAAIGGLRRGDHGASYRLLGAVAFGLAVLIAALGVATLGIQVGRTDPGVPLPVLLLPGTLLAAAAAGLVGWAVQPRLPWRPTPTATAAPVPVRAGERVVWMQGVTLARAGAVVLGIAFVIGCLAVLPVLFFGDPVAAIISGLVVVVLFVVVATTLRFHVRVDAEGLTVVSAAGWPRVHIPTEDVLSAEVVEVSPFGEFGGWGVRWSGGGRQGVVLRAGEGILVRRRDGGTLTVTVDDAAAAAGLLTTYAALTSGRRGD